MVTVREIKETDLPEIFSWFESRKWPLPPVDGIGPKFGMIAEDETGPLSCLWVYITGTAIADVDWLATNPRADQSIASASLSVLINHLKAWSKTSEGENKVRALRFYTKNEKLAEIFGQKEFRRSSEYIRMLWTMKD